MKQSVKLIARFGLDWVENRFPLSVEKALMGIPVIRIGVARAREILVNHDLKTIYVPVPKNACTVLATMMAIYDSSINDFNPRNEGVHQYRWRRNSEPLLLTDFSYLQREDYFKFSVVRDPYDRLVSGYLDKLVKQRLANYDGFIETVQRYFGESVDLDGSISFEQFLEYICACPDYKLDKHWRPQYRFLNNIPLDYVARFEDMESIFKVLDKKLGVNFKQKVLPAVRYPKRTNYSAVKSKAELNASQENEFYGEYRASTLRALGAYPNPDAFYNPRLKQMVEYRFERDLEIYYSACTQLL